MKTTSMLLLHDRYIPFNLYPPINNSFVPLESSLLTLVTISCLPSGQRTFISGVFYLSALFVEISSSALFTAEYNFYKNNNLLHRSILKNNITNNSNLLI